MSRDNHKVVARHRGPGPLDRRIAQSLVQSDITSGIVVLTHRPGAAPGRTARRVATAYDRALQEVEQRHWKGESNE